MTEDKVDKLKPFKQHGVVFRGSNSTQAYGDCPFTGKEKKFYVNKETLLWDSKTAGVRGNLSHFLEAICDQNVEDITKSQLQRLSNNRKLPIESFKDLEIGKSSKGYTFPVRDEKGNIVDLRMYRPGGKVIGTAGCPTWLFNVKELIKAPISYPVYLCEGEWDCIAMRYLLKKIGEKAVAVGVPGASVFKKEWARYLKDRDVYVCYDNDEAGENGELTVKDRLTGVANSLRYLHWSGKFPPSFDIRDLVADYAIGKKVPRKTMLSLKKMFVEHPRKKPAEEDSIAGQPGEEVDLNTSLEDVDKTFRKWLYLKSLDLLYISLATAISNEIQGDPVWMFIVASSGGAKTEILSSFNTCRLCYVTSSLTPNSLISGANFTDGRDPSLIPKLDGKTLIIKDFTVILNMREFDKDGIFSILRDAYDGKCGKVYGTGVKREYVSHFSILSGVTPSIYNLSAQYVGLGERWLKFHVGGSIDHDHEEDIIMKAIDNVEKENKMRIELSTVVNNFVLSTIHKMRQPRFKTPEIPDDIKVKMIAAVQYAARMRGTVTRHYREHDMIMSKPFREVGSRLGKNMAKIMKSLAIIFGHKQVGEIEYRMARKILLDTVDQRAEEMVRKLYLATPTVDDALTTNELRSKTNYTPITIRRVMDDLCMLEVAKRVGKLNKFQYTLPDKIRFLIKEAGFYEIPSEINRERADAELVEVRQEARKKVRLKGKKRLRLVRRKKRN